MRVIPGAPELEENDPLSVEHLKSTILFAIFGALIIYAASIAILWGDWPRVVMIAAIAMTAMVFNWLVTAQLSPRVGYERAEDLRVLPNIFAIVCCGLATHWSLVALAFFPFSAALVTGVHTRRPTIRLVITISTSAAVALATGVDVVQLLVMLGLTGFWHIVAVGKINFARAILIERQQSLHRLATAQESLIANERLASIGLVASGVAHEINNPMAFITSNVNGLLEDLQTELPLPSDYRDEIIPSTLDGIRRVNAIVDDLRRFARGEPETPITFDLTRELNAAVRIARSQLRGGQAVRTEFQEGDLALQGMPRQISQVALNLIINAIQASGENGEVVVTATIDGKNAVFRVKDTGAGIPPEVLEKLFTPFVTTKAAGKGTGLGLAVAHGMIKAHGGRITVASEVGKGTTFEVFLPRG